MLQVQVFIGGLLDHFQQILTGLHDLQSNGVLQVDLRPRSRARHIPDSDACLWVVIHDPAAGRDCKVCFDMGDGGRIRSRGLLLVSDVYFKRSFFEPAYEAFDSELKSKIRPYGVNYPCAARTSLEFRLRLAWANFVNCASFFGIDRVRAVKESLKALISTERLRWLDRAPYLPTEEFEATPEDPTEWRVLFQTRVWDPALFGDDASTISELNQFRSSTVRALKRNFGDAFVGGIEPDRYAKERYSDCLSAYPTGKREYVSMMKSCLIGISTNGVHGSIPFKIGEYLASSRCIVSERLKYTLPVPLREAVNWLTFSSPEGCVNACETILGDPVLALEMRRANWKFYNEEVQPGAVLSRCLKIGLDRTGIGADALTKPDGLSGVRRLERQ